MGWSWLICSPDTVDVLYVKYWVCVMCLKANWSKDGFLLWLRVSSTWCSHQKAASFKHETTFTLDKKRRKFYNHSSRAYPTSKLYISSGERTLERAARPGKAEETESSLFLSRYSLTRLLARAAHAWLLTTPLNWELAPRLHKTLCQDLTI